MKKVFAILLVVLGLVSLLSGCAKKNDAKVITICASDVPHAEVLEGVVKEELKKLGYTLKVTILDWSVQNQAVASKDYDCNYFQHIPYLESDSGAKDLFAVVKVHYEPLGIYYGKASVGTSVTEGRTFAICNDVSNAIRAFNLLEAKGVITSEEKPVNNNGDALTFEGDTWTNGTITVSLVAENLLVASLPDYDFACLPCNTAYTGNVDSSKRAAVEDDPAQVSAKANILAARLSDYQNDKEYKEKIDALADVLLSEAVSEYFKTKYLGAMTCDSSTQIDLRTNAK